MPINLTTLQACLNTYIMPPAGLSEHIKVIRVPSGALAIAFASTGNVIITEPELAGLTDPEKVVVFLQGAVEKEKAVQAVGVHKISYSPTPAWSSTPSSWSGKIEEKAKAAITSPLEAKLDLILSRLDDLEGTVEMLQEQIGELNDGK